MFKKTILSAVMALGLATTGYAAEHGEPEIEDIAFGFEGVFGTYDAAELQRGLQVFTEVCSACHGLNLVAYRTLGDEGGPMLPEDQIKAYAAQYEAYDPELDDFRPAIPSDKFGDSQYDGAPDLSLMAKARKGFEGPYGLVVNPLFRGVGGPEYIVAILNGYTGEEKDLAGNTVYENTAFPGGWIRMPPPLSDELVEFDPAAPNDQQSLSEDVASFLMWTAEPKLVQRKKAGLVAVIFLGFLAVMLYLTNKKIWAKAKRKD
jgi:ubiquinol-cytochrome c reductase cytochrome c1 subunit